MNKARTRTVAMVLGLLGVLVAAGGAVAQASLQIGGNRANFGVHRLSPGFTPDPKVVNVVSGGNIDASTLGYGADCGGWVTRQPDAIVHLSGQSNFLRFFVRGQGNGDTTLVINDGGGRWHCNDDSAPGSNLNPVVDIRNAPAGQYDIWIGSYRSGEQIRGTLNITELESQRP